MDRCLILKKRLSHIKVDSFWKHYCTVKKKKNVVKELCDKLPQVTSLQLSTNNADACKCKNWEKGTSLDLCGLFLICARGYLLLPA